MDLVSHRSWQEVVEGLIAGFVATTIMTLLLLPLSRAIDVGVFDFAAVLGAIFTDQSVTAFSRAWWVGMAEHFFNGTVIFPLIYLFVLEKEFPPMPRWIRGVLWGIVLWIGWQAVVMPFSGLGFFSLDSSDGPFILFMTFNSHMIYGGLFGALLSLEERRHRTTLATPETREAA